MQLTFNGLIAAGTIALIAVSFSLIYNVSKFFHFAHGAIYTIGAYLTYLFFITLGFPLFPAIIIAILVCAFMCCLVEIFIYKPLRNKEASSLVLLMASLGLYIILQNIISLIFGDAVKTLRSGLVAEGMDILGAKVTPYQILIILTSLVLIGGIAILLKKTKMGVVIRAVSGDPDLANVSGVDGNKVVLLTLATGSALAGLAAILVSLDVDMTPTMGMNALMMGVVVVIVGGQESISGIALGALLLGLAQQFGVYYLGSEWRDAIAFAILLIFLLFRPQGFMGRSIKKITV